MNKEKFKKASEVRKSFEWIRKYRFPLTLKEGENYYQCIQKWIAKYIDDLEKCKYIPNEKITNVQKYTNEIICSLKDFLNGNIPQAYCTFYRALDMVKSNLRCVGLGENPCNPSIKSPYYRVLKCGSNCFNYKQMLHIPYNLRECISACRFSLSGIPCSYMSSSPVVAWYEAGMPDEYQIAKYTALGDDYKLLSLDINLQDVFFEIYEHALETEERLEDKIIETIVEVIYTLPLVAFCSVVKKRDDAKFNEEYIVPQLLMSWISSRTDCVGIRYRTNKRFELGRSVSAYNIALPALQEDSDHYSIKLKQIFDINGYCEEKHKLQNISINKEIEKEYGDKIKRLSEYYETIYKDYRHSNVPSVYEDYLALSRIALSNIKLIKDEKTDNDFVSDKKYNAFITLRNLRQWIMDVKTKSNSINYEFGFNGKKMLDNEIARGKENVKLFLDEIYDILFELTNIDYHLLEVKIICQN